MSVRDADTGRSGNEITVDGRRISLAYSVCDVRVVDGTAVVQTTAWVENWSDPTDWGDVDVEVAPYHRNVLGFDGDGAVAWQVGAPPHDLPASVVAAESRVEAGEPWFRSLLTLDGQLFGVNVNDWLYRLDAETGAYRESYRANRFPLDDAVLEFPSEARVEEVVAYEDLVVVLFEGADTDRNVHAFDRSGTRQWRAEPAGGTWPYVGLWVDDGALMARSGDHRHELDPASGEHLSSQFFK